MKSAIEEYGVLIIEVLVGICVFASLFILAGLTGIGSCTLKGIAETVANYICP